MKKLLLLLLLLFAVSGFSQNKTPGSGTDNLTYALARLDQLPELVSGEAFKDFFRKNFHPSEKLSEPLKMYFTVERNGLALDVKVFENVTPETAKEATRVLKLAGKWKPGTKDGKIVRVRYSFAFEN